MVGVGIEYIRAIVTGAVVITLTINMSRFGCWFLTHLAVDATVLVRERVTIVIVRHYGGCLSLISRKYVMGRQVVRKMMGEKEEEKKKYGEYHIRYFSYVTMSRQLIHICNYIVTICIYKEPMNSDPVNTKRNLLDLLSDSLRSVSYFTSVRVRNGIT